MQEMEQDPIMKEANLRLPPPAADTSKMPSVIYKMLSTDYQAIVTLSLAGNGIANFRPWTSLPSFLPALANLSLAQNSLRSVSDLDPLSNASPPFTNLNELLLAGNPLAGHPTYRQSVLFTTSFLLSDSF